MRFTRGGTVLVLGVLATLLLALTGVAGASPRNADAPDRSGHAGHDHDAGRDAAERARDRREAAQERRHSGTWTIRRSPLAPGLAPAAPPVSPATPPTTVPPQGPVPVVGPGRPTMGPPAGAAGAVAVRAAQPAAGVAPHLGLKEPTAPSGSVRPSPPAGSVAAPWYLSLAGAGSLSPAFRGGLRAAVRLSVPIAVAGLVLIFLVIQALIARRDPKLAEAPIRRNDDGMSFE